jgi:GNAT superfamily N-acetyltransferase
VSQETLRLRLATRDDLPAFLELTEELFDNTIYSTFSTFDTKHVSDRFLASLEGDQTKVCTVVLVNGEAPVGLITMARTGFMNKEEMAVEIAFWIKPEYRTKKTIKMLLQAYFYWARKVGCKAAFVGKLKGRQAPEQYLVRRL